MSTKTMSADKKYYIHSIIGLIIMFGFGFLPAFSTVTPYGMKMLGILLGLIYLWSFVDMGWPSLVAGVAYVLTGGITMNEFLASGFGTSNVLISIFATGFAFAIANQGAFDYIAKWLLSNKIFSGRPWVLTIGLMLIVYILNCCYAGMAVLFIVWALLPKIGDACGLEKQHPWYAAVVVGTVFCLIMAECTFPFRPMTLFTYSMASGYMPLGELPMVGFILYMIMLVVGISLIYVAILRFIVRIDLSKMKSVDVTKLVSNEDKMTKQHKFCLGLLAVFILAMILVGSSGLFPDGIFKTLLQKLTITGVSIVFFAFGCIIRVNGQPLIRLRTIAKDIPWDICLLLSVITTFCAAVASEETGISALFANITAPILAGHSPLVFMILVLVVSIIATNFLNNTVVMVVMFNIIAGYVPVLTGMNFTAFFVMIMVFAQIAFLLPASSVWGGFCHSQAEMCSTKNIYIAAIAAMVAGILALVFAIPVGNLIF